MQKKVSSLPSSSSSQHQLKETSNPKGVNYLGNLN